MDSLTAARQNPLKVMFDRSCIDFQLCETPALSELLLRRVPMSPQKTLVICKSSHHQNTQRVASVIADVLKADLCTPASVSSEVLRDYDLIGFGSGIYFGRFDSSLRAWIQHLPDSTSEDLRNAFIFSTSGLSFLWRLWHWPLRRLLTRKGFKVIREFHCSGLDTVGPLRFVGGLNRQHPTKRDLENAATFARALAATFRQN